MTTLIELPHVGESVTQGVIAKWLVQPGQRVERYDPLVEVVTDKITMEAPSPHSGVFVRALVDEGDTVPMGQPICEMDIDGETPSPADDPIAVPAPADSSQMERMRPELGGLTPAPADSSPPPQPPSSRNFEFVSASRSVGPTGFGEGGQGRPDAIQDAALAAASPDLSPDRPDRSRVISPLVARLAAQRNIDLSTLAGTGAGGRITKHDVLRAAETSASPQPPSAAPSASAAPPRPDSAPPPAGPPASMLPLTAIRRTIAEHMARSAREIPAAWSMVEADVTGLVRARAAHRTEFQRQRGVPLTYLPFVAVVVAAALHDHPRLNAQWSDDHITLNHRVNLGVAVAADHGLIVPVVRDAASLSIAQMAGELARLINAARAAALQLDDVQGGTFTLNNTGALGSIVSVPIINHPQAAILAAEAIVKRPVVVDGDAIAVRSMMNLCLAFDHRVCDGAEASAFLRAVKEGLEAVNEQTPLA